MTALERLKEFLNRQGEQAAPEPLTPDASTREYFRIDWKGRKAVACVYPAAFEPDLSFLDTTGLFAAARVPVAEVLFSDADEGIVIQQDLGSVLLADHLASCTQAGRERMLDQAIGIIARIQAATSLAVERNSIASRLKFDREKLLWELDFFLTHHFESLLKKPVSKALEQSVKGEFVTLAVELEGFSRVLTHRDFHASNIMVVGGERLVLIDHQDARLGSAAYDLVSLLLDRVTEPSSDEYLAGKRRLLLEAREKEGLEMLDEDAFHREFDLVAIQRCLKAIGTFSNQAGNFGKSHYIRYIAPMFGIVNDTCSSLGKFPAIREMIARARGDI